MWLGRTSQKASLKRGEDRVGDVPVKTIKVQRDKERGPLGTRAWSGTDTAGGLVGLRVANGRKSAQGTGLGAMLKLLDHYRTLNQELQGH